METLLRGSDNDLDDHAVRTRELEEEFDRRARGDAPPQGDAAAEQAPSGSEGDAEQAPQARSGPEAVAE
ncbi:hypothetical protein Skr01_16500 [Sphaerisporangium krabiense]|nr:hypothetical protein Skr01_16500 [Sphaerisporangium krabiense]